MIGSHCGLDQGHIRSKRHQRPPSIQQHHHSEPHQGMVSGLSVRGVLPLTTGHMLENQSNLMLDFSKIDKDDQIFNGDVKWTGSKVSLLITAVSYIRENAAVSECHSGVQRNDAFLPKKGDWKAISKVMTERGFNVSPQECRYKFNDLYNKYNKLNVVLGRGISCKVVENPSLLDTMGYLSEKTKEVVRKIMCSKHLFYEEMCSYHNRNRLHLPHDPALKWDLEFAPWSSDSRRHVTDNSNDGEQDADAGYHKEWEDSCSRVSHSFTTDIAKRMQQELGLWILAPALL